MSVVLWEFCEFQDWKFFSEVAPYYILTIHRSWNVVVLPYCGDDLGLTALEEGARIRSIVCIGWLWTNKPPHLNSLETGDICGTSLRWWLKSCSPFLINLWGFFQSLYGESDTRRDNNKTHQKNLSLFCSTSLFVFVPCRGLYPSVLFSLSPPVNSGS